MPSAHNVTLITRRSPRISIYLPSDYCRPYRMSNVSRCLTNPYSIRFTEGETTMAQGHQRGWLKKEKRAQGETWVLFFRTTRKSDGKRVENKIPIGLIQHLPDASSAWAEVERLHVPIKRVDVRRGLTFGDLAQHYAEHELVDCSESIRPKAHTTIKAYERVLRNRLLPRWGNRIALGIEPLEVEQWLKTLKIAEELANP